jgi:hypothetical protein
MKLFCVYGYGYDDPLAICKDYTEAMTIRNFLCRDKIEENFKFGQRQSDFPDEEFWICEYKVTDFIAFKDAWGHKK